jgi:hypothetical protein
MQWKKKVVLCSSTVKPSQIGATKKKKDFVNHRPQMGIWLLIEPVAQW